MSCRGGILALMVAAMMLVPALPAVAQDEAFASSSLLAPEDDLELKAMRLLSDPAVVRARRQGEQELLASLPNASPATRAHFREAMDEIAFFGILNGLNDDPLHPRITLVGRPGRTIRGVKILAPKGLDENPDSIYRIIPVDGASTYVLRGRVAKNRPVVNEFSVLDDDWKTVGNLSSANLVTRPDGSFEITVGPKPATGRSNYIQTRPGANYMTIRDTMGDWAQEQPNRLEVEWVSGPPSAPALTREHELEKVVAKVKRYFAETIKLHKAALARPANDFPQPAISSAQGMLVTQAYSIGRFELAKDQALVLTIHPGTAPYVTVPVTNFWGTTMDPVHHMSSRNSRQVVSNPDGSFTVIVSAADPGLENWVDTEGLTEGFLFLRWAAMDAASTGNLAVDSKVVTLADLATAVPKTLPKVDAAERAQQIVGRAQEYDLRWGGN